MEPLKGGKLEVVKMLLAEPSIDVNVQDKNGATPLWWATRNDHDDVAARLLAKQNIDVNAVGQFEAPEPDRSTSLHDVTVKHMGGLLPCRRRLCGVDHIEFAAPWLYRYFSVVKMNKIYADHYNGSSHDAVNLPSLTKSSQTISLTPMLNCAIPCDASDP